MGWSQKTCPEALSYQESSALSKFHVLLCFPVPLLCISVPSLSCWQLSVWHRSHSSWGGHQSPWWEARLLSGSAPNPSSASSLAVRRGLPCLRKRDGHWEQKSLSEPSGGPQGSATCHHFCSGMGVNTHRAPAQRSSSGCLCASVHHGFL